MESGIKKGSIVTPHLFKLCSQTKEKGKETDLDVGVGFSNETNKFWIEISHKHCTMIRIRRGAAMIPLAGNKYLSLYY
jgi:predicted transposase YbfD/YdcC